MSWCDKLASTPSVGFQFEPHYVASDLILNSFAPLLDNWAKTDKKPVDIERHDSFSLTFTTQDGFQYGVEPTRSFVNFTHRMKIKTVSAGPPVAEMLSHPLPYSSLLPEVSKRLIEATMLLPNIKKRSLKRVGIISNTTVSEDELPPGIARFIGYLGRPWKGNVEGVGMQVIANLSTDAAFSDRCIHIIAKPENPEELMTLKFDWQRKFDTERVINADALRQVLEDAGKASTKYFEDLAEGNRFDENILGSDKL